MSNEVEENLTLFFRPFLNTPEGGWTPIWGLRVAIGERQDFPEA
ncbi:MAG: hypothetical protein WAL98_05925 [Desulfatiglandaceae bacterium]|jgi:hypothetical protein